MANRSVEEVRKDLNERYKKYIQDPSITVTPIKLNTRLQELRATVDARQGIGGQQREARVTPDGTIQLPGLGSIPTQGLTLGELKREIDVRYTQLVQGLEVTPILIERAPALHLRRRRSEVARPLRVDRSDDLDAVDCAGRRLERGRQREHIIVFRRDECWNLMATQLTVCKVLFGHAPCPADEIWLRDSDVVVVPKRAILVVDDAINLIFTRGLYGVVPFNFTVFQGLSTGVTN